MEADSQLTASWRSPSNIAIIKYWGKHGNQLPANPSVSITLSVAHTDTTISAIPTRIGKQSLEFRFEGKQKPAFADRVEKYLAEIVTHVPALANLHLKIDTSNSFPHSSGIASSASAMSALALCLEELQSRIASDPDTGNAFYRHASLMSRLGSGSACRSIYGPVCLWGHVDAISGSSDEYAIPLTGIHPVFETFQDSILIVDEGVKSVSSSAGHALMQGHPFAGSRIAQVHQHIRDLHEALKTGDLDRFGQIAEAEAMSLHALMMTSSPSFILMKPNTLYVLEAVRTFRRETGSHVYFTLDAGPNVHLLYPAEEKTAVQAWINTALLRYCKDGRVIHDFAGKGPERLA